MSLFSLGKKDGTPADDILDNRFCDLCKRHCPLSSPKCGRGRRKAREMRKGSE